MGKGEVASAQAERIPERANPSEGREGLNAPEVNAPAADDSGPVGARTGTSDASLDPGIVLEAVKQGQSVRTDCGGVQRGRAEGEERTKCDGVLLHCRPLLATCILERRWGALCDHTSSSRPTESHVELSRGVGEDGRMRERVGGCGLVRERPRPTSSKQALCTSAVIFFARPLPRILLA